MRRGACFSSGSGSIVRMLWVRSANLIKQNPDVSRHRDRHLADGGRLLLFPARELDPVELGDAVDEQRHLLAEVSSMSSRVMSVSSTTSCSRAATMVSVSSPYVGQDLGHRQRVRDVRIAALAHAGPRGVAAATSIGPVEIGGRRRGAPDDASTATADQIVEASPPGDCDRCFGCRRLLPSSESTDASSRFRGARAVPLVRLGRSRRSDRCCRCGLDTSTGASPGSRVLAGTALALHATRASCGLPVGPRVPSRSPAAVQPRRSMSTFRGRRR